MANDWLADIVVVNESRSEAKAGDIALFRTAGEACNNVEYWWVEEQVPFTAAGVRRTLGVDGKGRVIVTSKQSAPGGAGIVVGWLLTCAVSVLEARRARAKKGESDPQLF